MAGEMSNYLETAIQNHILGNTAYTAPATVYVSLHTATLDDTSTATTSEVSGGSYARVALTNNTTNWPAASGVTASKSNGTAITFPTATASWGTVTFAAIVDSASGAGNILWRIPLTVSKTISSGDTFSFAIGQITLTVD